MLIHGNILTCDMVCSCICVLCVKTSIPLGDIRYIGLRLIGWRGVKTQSLDLPAWIVWSTTWSSWNWFWSHCCGWCFLVLSMFVDLGNAAVKEGVDVPSPIMKHIYIYIEGIRLQTEIEHWLENWEAMPQKRYSPKIFTKQQVSMISTYIYIGFLFSIPLFHFIYVYICWFCIHGFPRHKDRCTTENIFQIFHVFKYSFLLAKLLCKKVGDIFK